MSRSDRTALLLSLIAVAVTFWLARAVFESLAHLEDELAYVWQAQVMARGDLTVASPFCPRCFLQPFVVDYESLRFGKYPPGWPALLGFGVQFGARAWVNPLLAGLSVWLTYRLGKKIAGETVGLLAAGLTLVSPFFLMNSASLLAHTWTLVLTLALALAWLDTFSPAPTVPRPLTAAVAALSLGLLALTRPLTGVAVAIPFFAHGLYLLVRGDASARKAVLGIGAGAGLLASLVLVWQYAVTGDPFLNPYTLWWPYDRIGFGPQVGLNVGGHSLWFAYVNTKFSLKIGMADFFGWFQHSWLFLPFGLVALRRNRRAWLLAAIFACIVLAYGLYWIGSWIVGPRYYFEGLPALTIFTAAGVVWLAGKLPPNPFRRLNGQTLRFGLVTLLVVFLVTVSARYYMPARFATLKGLYNATETRLAPFRSEQAQALTPALVIVHYQQHWMEYGTLLELSNPYFDTPFVFTVSRGPDMDTAVAALFPERQVWHYYTDEPYRFYNAPRE